MTTLVAAVTAAAVASVVDDEVSAAVATMSVGAVLMAEAAVMLQLLP